MTPSLCMFSHVSQSTVWTTVLLTDHIGKWILYPGIITLQNPKWGPLDNCALESGLLFETFSFRGVNGVDVEWELAAGVILRNSVTVVL